jgi:phenylacetate-CoA ligase
MALPAGPGNVDLQCQFMLDMQSTVLCCTASMGLLLAEEINQRGLTDQDQCPQGDLWIRTLVAQSMRQKISAPARRGGTLRHYRTDRALRAGDRHRMRPARLHSLLGATITSLEILNPETLEPVPAGEWGEMVVTTVRKKPCP